MPPVREATVDAVPLKLGPATPVATLAGVLIAPDWLFDDESAMDVAPDASCRRHQPTGASAVTTCPYASGPLGSTTVG